jgi:hypothetical protein
MKLIKIFIAVLLMFIICMTACAGLQTTSPPTPVVKWSFDVSKRDSKIIQDFRIDEYRSYYIALRFNYFGEKDLYRVLSLVGNGSSKYPGIDIPIHIKIYKLDTKNKSEELISENEILTKNYYAGGFEHNQSNGNYKREIIKISLTPGTYRVEANTIEDRPEFSSTPSYLQIEWHSKIRFLPNSIKIK